MEWQYHLTMNHRNEAHNKKKPCGGINDEICQFIRFYNVMCFYVSTKYIRNSKR